jgi:uncharacterized heparinase superfamily protein
MGQALLEPIVTRSADDEFQEWAIGSTIESLECSPASVSMAPSGRFVLANDSFWCLVECGEVGQRGNGGHAHNDTLSFVLAACGQELITDPGTGVYTRDLAMRDRFRRTRSHSTVEIDGEEINPFERGAPFRLVGLDRPVVEHADLAGTPQRVTVRHFGYLRLPDPVTHRRSFELWQARFVVTDYILCEGRHTAIFTLPLVPGIAVEQRANDWLLRAGPAAVVMRQVDGDPLRLVTTDLDVSTRYGAWQPSLCLQGDIALTGPSRWAFEFMLLGETA